MKRSGLSAYQQQERAGAEVAKPEQVVGILFTKLIDTLTKVHSYIERKDLANKQDRLNLSLDIFTVLEGSLDHEKGGEIASNLKALYQYCQKRLMEANASNDPAIITEVIGLVKEVQEGWRFVTEKQPEQIPTPQE